MHFVTLAFFSVLCSSTFGVGAYYEYMREDEAMTDDVSDDDNKVQALNGDDNRNDSIDDDEDRVGDTIDAIKSGINDGIDDSDDDVNDDIDVKKLNAENVGIDGNDEAADSDDGVNGDNNKKLNAENIGINGNDEMADSDDDVNDDIENEKLDAGNVGIHGNDGVADSDDGENGDIENKNLNTGIIGINENDAIADSNDGANDDVENNKLFESGSRPIKNGHTFLTGSDGHFGNDELDVKQYQRELAAGDLSELLGNTHHDDQRYYKDLSRRFVPVYPYKKRTYKHRKPNPDEIIRLLLSPKRSQRDDEEPEIVPIRFPKRSLRDDEDTEIVPIRASPELVLAVMKNGTKTYASKPSEPTEEVIRQYMLRSGDYWDNVWKEEVVPSSGLRTKKHQKQSSNPQPILAKLTPGTKLYDLLARIVKKTPKLVYIINN